MRGLNKLAFGVSRFTRAVFDSVFGWVEDVFLKNQQKDHEKMLEHEDYDKLKSR